MNAFDKLCGVLAFGLGSILLILGVLGAFIGCKAHFSLPPVFGVIPAFAGWGIVRSIYLAWTTPRDRPQEFDDSDFNAPDFLRPPE